MLRFVFRFAAVPAPHRLRFVLTGVLSIYRPGNRYWRRYGDARLPGNGGDCLARLRRVTREQHEGQLLEPDYISTNRENCLQHAIVSTIEASPGHFRWRDMLRLTPLFLECCLLG